VKRALTLSNLKAKKYKIMDFQGKWKRSFGCPEMKGTWLIYGHSGHGKTRFAVQLLKYLTKFSRVLYNTMEEGASASFTNACIAEGLEAVESQFLILDNESMDELRDRLHRQRSANIIFIDSIQYSRLNYKSYISLKEEFPKKLFIFLSHAKGKSPKGATAESVEFDANVKIFVNQYIAYPKSRYEGNEPYAIWKDRAEAI